MVAASLTTIYFVLRDYAHNLGNAPLVFLLTFVMPFLMYLTSPDDSAALPPRASPSVPFLGNALHYQKNPDLFLAKQAKLLGGIFTINLAGLQTTILSSKQAMKQLAFTPERVLSSNAAVADFGFRYTLGDRNVFAGTDVHKRIIKQQYSKPNHLEETSQLYWKYLNDAIKSEVMCEFGQEVLVNDFCVTVRRVILRTITYEMIGSGVVNAYNTTNDADFISDFMIFQDLVEDCTAKAAVCPTWLASFLFLNDCEKKRLVLVSKLSIAMKQAMDGGDVESVGKWLLTANAMTKADDSKLYQVDEIADFAVGLLFAAHKNPSIAAAQSILHALEFDNTAQNGCNQVSLMSELYSEAISVKEKLSDHDDGNLVETLNTCSAIEKTVLETLRVTAHSIGSIRKVMAEGGWKVNVEDERIPGSPVKQYILPYGSYVGVSHIIPHRSPIRWGKNCADFDPYRENLIHRSKNDLEFTNFSHGVHKCPGSVVALLIMRLFVVALLSHYEVSLQDTNEGEPPLPSTTFERATLAQRSGPCILKFKRLIE